jgi:hypothetical protein
MMINGNVVKKLRLQDVEIAKENFLEKCHDEFEELRQHIARIKNQYQQIKLLRQNLEPMKQVTCQIDYAENYNCCQQDEPSGAFYDRRQITIHPMVVHFNDIDHNLQHRSYVGVTDERSHAAPTTFAFIKKLIPELQKTFPELNCIHYISDSPVNQYRNRSIVKIVADHCKIFPGVSCTWDYLETGHGKGPCDGVGGSIKKGADIAVKAGHTISDGKEFYSWAEKFTSMKCLYITPGDVQNAGRYLTKTSPVKGLSVVHSLQPYQEFVWMREMSCYRECCLQNLSCPGWINTQVPLSHVTVEETVTDANANVGQGDVPKQVYSVDDMVEAEYNGKIYVGKIMRYDSENDDYYITFMKKVKKGYVWPKRRDEVWIQSGSVLKLFEDSNKE